MTTPTHGQASAPRTPRGRPKVYSGDPVVRLFGETCCSAERTHTPVSVHKVMQQQVCVRAVALPRLRCCMSSNIQSMPRLLHPGDASTCYSLKPLAFEFQVCLRA